MRFLAFFFLSFLLATPVEADSSCYDDKLVLEQDFLWDFRQGFLESIPLPTIYQGIIHPGPLFLHLGTDGRPFLFGSYEWPKKVGEVSFPHLPYRLQIEIGEDGDQVIDQDYSHDCMQTPLGISPGDRLKLLPIKLHPRKDGSPLGTERVHLRYWGK